MKTAVLSVAYKKSGPYFTEFLGSLSNQTDKDYDIYLVNDDLPKIERLLSDNNISARIKQADGTPAKLRKIGIEWVINEKADIIIFADSDDYFKNNRIAVIKDLLSDVDIAVNDLELVGEGVSPQSAILGHHFQEGAGIGIQDIRSKNCLGLSNTAITVKKIPANFYQIPDTIIAFDWAFFSMCLATGCSIKFTKKTTTYYRQHQQNIAPLNSLNKDQLLKGVRVKRDHYRFLKRYSGEYSSKSKDFSDLLEKLERDEHFSDTYMQRVQKQSPIKPLWWEIFKSPGELGL